MLLSDEEIGAMTLPYSYAYINDVSACKEFVRTIESAILEKLAAKELPEPVGAYELVVGQEEWQGFPSEIIEMRDAYSAAQLQEAHAQGFAAGAAEQLSAEPVAFTDADFMSIFVSKDIAQDCGATIELYTRREA